MKALLTLLIGLVLFTGCASTSKMSEEDRFLWDEPSASGNSARTP